MGATLLAGKHKQQRIEVDKKTYLDVKFVENVFFFFFFFFFFSSPVCADVKLSTCLSLPMLMLQELKS